MYVLVHFAVAIVAYQFLIARKMVSLVYIFVNDKTTSWYKQIIVTATSLGTNEKPGFFWLVIQMYCGFSICFEKCLIGELMLCFLS